MRMSKVACLLFLVFFSAPILSAERIVSIGGSITEILYQLDMQDKIVAVDTTSQYPQSTQNIDSVGYMRALSAEPIIALQPDLILYQEDAGPIETIEHLNSASMNLVKISNKHSVKGVLEKVKQVSIAVDKEVEGKLLIAQIQDQLNNLPKKAGGDQPRVMFVLSFDQASALVAGKHTGADGIISLAGGINAVDDFISYKPLSAEAIINLKPDYILTTYRALSSIGSKEKVLALPALRLTPAARDNNLIVMDGLLLLGFGPRIAHAANDLSNAINNFQ